MLGLVVGEALFLTMVGGLIGFGLAYLAVGGDRRRHEDQYFPVFEIDAAPSSRRSCSWSPSGSSRACGRR